MSKFIEELFEKQENRENLYPKENEGRESRDP